MAQGDKILYLVCEPGVKPNTELLDPKLNAHVVKATSPKAAAVIYGIKSWALYRCGEEMYDVYDKTGELVDQCTIPAWVDDAFGQCIKEAFHVEVLVERNDIGYGQTNPDEVKAAVDALSGHGIGGGMQQLSGPGTPAANQAAMAAIRQAAQAAGFFDAQGNLVPGASLPDDDDDDDDEGHEYEPNELEFAVTLDANDPFGNGCCTVYIHPRGHYDEEGCLYDQSLSWSDSMLRVLDGAGISEEMESTFSSNYKTVAEAVADLTSAGLDHHQGLEDFLNRCRS